MSSSSVTGPFWGQLNWLHVYIAGTAFAVCAFVALVIIMSSQKRKIDYNSGVFTYLKFAYATFLKPHEKHGNGQQDALESFYKTQVCETDHQLTVSVPFTDRNDTRPVCMTPLASVCCAVERICWVWLRLNSSTRSRISSFSLARLSGLM